MTSFQFLIYLFLGLGIAVKAFVNVQHSVFLHSMKSKPQAPCMTLRATPRADLFNAIFSLASSDESKAFLNNFNNFVIPGILIALPSLAFIGLLLAEKKFANGRQPT